MWQIRICIWHWYYFTSWWSHTRFCAPKIDHFGPLPPPCIPPPYLTTQTLSCGQLGVSYELYDPNAIVWYHCHSNHSLLWHPTTHSQIVTNFSPFLGHVQEPGPNTWQPHAARMHPSNNHIKSYRMTYGMSTFVTIKYGFYPRIYFAWNRPACDDSCTFTVITPPPDIIIHWHVCHSIDNLIANPLMYAIMYDCDANLAICLFVCMHRGAPLTTSPIFAFHLSH